MQHARRMRKNKGDKKRAKKDGEKKEQRATNKRSGGL
jgi:hypothetical protein